MHWSNFRTQKHLFFFCFFGTLGLEKKIVIGGIGHLGNEKKIDMEAGRSILHGHRGKRDGNMVGNKEKQDRH